MTLRGIIFDLDGTLADTLPVCIQAFQETMLHFNSRRPSDAEIISLFGPTEEGILETLLPERRLDETLPCFLAEYARLHERLCRQLFPGVENALSLLKANGIRMAIVSGKGQQSADISLRVLGLDRWIDCVETGFADRPDKPRSIRKVLDHWKILPDQAAYVGDMPSDMQSARQAGVLPLGAAWAESSTLHGGPDGQAAVMFYDIDSFIEWIKTVNE